MNLRVEILKIFVALKIHNLLKYAPIVIVKKFYK